MKIRNVVFSGFAAAIFAGVCGTVDAATVNLVKYETYTAGMESKQDKLTAGDNISIEDNTISATLNDYAKSTDVNTALALKANTADLAAVATTGSYADLKNIPADLVKQSGLEEAVQNLTALIGDKADAADLTTLNNAVTALQSGKADASTVTALQETVTNLGQTYATDAEVAAAVAEVEGKIPSLTEYAKTADVAAIYATQDALAGVQAKADAAAAKSYVDAELAKKQNELQLGENLQWVDGKLDTKGIATADGLAELETKVNNAAQKTDVANSIAQALADAKKYADDNDADTLYDDAQVKADIAANTAAIATKANSADVYTKTEVDGQITTATADLATKTEMNAVSAVANAAAVKADVDAALENIYTKEQVDAAIDAIEEYDDTALAGRVTANETAISTNAGAIDAIETKTDALKALAYKDTVATGDIDNNAVTTAKIAGQAAQAGEMMMMTAGEDGVATWTAVKVY